MFTTVLAGQNSNGRQRTWCRAHPVELPRHRRDRRNVDGSFGHRLVGDRYLEVDDDRLGHTDHRAVERVERRRPEYRCAGERRRVLPGDRARWSHCAGIATGAGGGGASGSAGGGGISHGGGGGGAKGLAGRPVRRRWDRRAARPDPRQRCPRSASAPAQYEGGKVELPLVQPGICIPPVRFDPVSHSPQRVELLSYPGELARS